MLTTTYGFFPHQVRVSRFSTRHPIGHGPTDREKSKLSGSAGPGTLCQKGEKISEYIEINLVTMSYMADIECQVACQIISDKMFQDKCQIKCKNMSAKKRVKIHVT